MATLKFKPLSREMVKPVNLSPGDKFTWLIGSGKWMRTSADLYSKAAAICLEGDLHPGPGQLAPIEKDAKIFRLPEGGVVTRKVIALSAGQFFTPSAASASAVCEHAVLMATDYATSDGLVCVHMDGPRRGKHTIFSRHCDVDMLELDES